MFIDRKARQLNLKVVYEGPISSGKATCLEYLHQDLDPGLRSRLCSRLLKLPHAAIGEHLMFFDFVPRSLPSIRGLQLRVHLYTVTGEEVYESTHRELLKGADALMFVADSRRAHGDANVEHRALIEGMLGQGVAARPEIPWAFSFNKRDLPDAAPVAELAARLDPGGRHPGVATVATRGEGVFAALTALLGRTLPAIHAELDRPASGA